MVVKLQLLLKRKKDFKMSENYKMKNEKRGMYKVIHKLTKGIIEDPQSIERGIAAEKYLNIPRGEVLSKRTNL